MAEDYGPVPVSRLKHETSRIFQALEGGRRVLVSRSGKVVAAIEPASVERHALQLANFAVPHSTDDIDELTATSIGQGSPSRAVHAAEQGRPSLVTRNNKVFGVMTGPRAELSLETVDATEKALANFERANPEATPAEFASVVATLDANVSRGALAVPKDPEEALLDALLVRASTLASIDHTEDAEVTLLGSIARFGGDPSAHVQQGVTRSMLALAKLYSDEGRSADALTLIDQAVARLESV